MPFCLTCNRWHQTLEGHPCLPRWEVRVEEEDEWHECIAHDAEEAATKFVEHYDSGDYAMLRGKTVAVEVRGKGHETVARFVVRGEMTAHYYARPDIVP